MYQTHKLDHTAVNIQVMTEEIIIETVAVVTRDKAIVITITRGVVTITDTATDITADMCMANIIIGTFGMASDIYLMEVMVINIANIDITI